MSLRAFVTGGSGFVGSNLLKQLCQAGWQVTALVRDTSPMEDIHNLDATFVNGDVTDANSVLAAMPADLDAVFHVAASTSIWSGNNLAQRRINVDGTRHVVDAAIRRNAKRLIHTSSFVVWGFHRDVLQETSPRLENADWINYVRTKFEAEEIVREAVANHGLDAVILNPAHILGPGDRHNWSRVIRMVHRNRLPGVPPGGGAFADVREVARAHINAFHNGRGGENYLLGGPDTQFIDIVRMTGKLLKRKVPARPTPSWLLKIIARLQAMVAAITRKEPEITPEGAAMITRHIQCDSSKATAELDYRFTAVDQLLADTCRWMRNKGMLN
ncbi:MAG: SDR family oxidoreductase [Xanthomonadales bacterium]|nr:SDR family oxidoreductase [Xanthomonadales bacterium]NNL94052.1 SDR family oxidoreductase [Xanthomonadales bacterium]